MELTELAMSAHCDDGTMTPDNALKLHIDYLYESLVKMGRPPPDLDFLQNLLKSAGFEDVQALKAKEPVGPWPQDPRLKRAGAMVLLHSETFFDSYGMAAFTRVLGMDAEKAEDICTRAAQAARNKNYHMYGVQ